VQGSRGAALHPDLDTRAVKLIVRKGMQVGLDSYSAFLETDHATSTGLAAYLNGMDVETISVCGLATDYCVYFTAMDAVEAGFRVQVITDACRGIDLPAGNLDRAMSSMQDAGVTFVASASL
jgi:nicotinamidase/pyrazinamidase